MTTFDKIALLTNKIDYLIPYGSRVYGTHSDKSDFDWIAIISDKNIVVTGTEFIENNNNITCYQKTDFQDQLNLHKIHALEAYFHPNFPEDQFKFNLNLETLRAELSQKASHSFVKAKKKIEKEKDYYIGWKSLFHSLRILKFGIQIAETGKLEDYGCANQYWFDILQAQRYDWEYFKDKYQPIYNEIATEFRKLAPKKINVSTN